jgi:hypothetical protein
MPQVFDPNKIRGRADERRHLTLRTSEVDDFLRFLLFDVARRPADLKIRECIRVARYLDWLIAGGVEKARLGTGQSSLGAFPRPALSAEERDKKRCTQQIADLLWRRVRTLNAQDAASNGEALSFLERHAPTHFANPFIERTLELVRDFDVPAADMRPRQQPTLVSASMMAYGSDPHLLDDLSERLFVADHALKRAGLSRRRKKIAEVLNKGHIQTRRRLRRDAAEQEWLPEDVHERVKAFEERMKRRLVRTQADLNPKELLLAERDAMTSRWIAHYREAFKIDVMPKAH